MNKKLVFIVGLQKSGTSLLFRLLQQTGLTENPFDREGHDFWGDVPPFEPVKFPTGAIYQRSMGERGHEIGSEEATEEVKRVLYQRLERIKGQAAIMINKNPYNTVRLPWLKTCLQCLLTDEKIRPSPRPWTASSGGMVGGKTPWMASARVRRKGCTVCSAVVCGK